MRLVNKDSREMVVEDASSLVMYHLWGCPSAHVFPFSFPLLFSFIRFIYRSYPFFCNFVRLSGSSAPITFMYSNFVYYLYMVGNTLSPWFLIPFLAVICMNVTSNDSLCMSCIKYIFSFPVLVNWVSYLFPPNSILRQSTPFPALGLLVLLFQISRFLVSISLDSILLSSWFFCASSYWYSYISYVCSVSSSYFFPSAPSILMVASSCLVWSWF